MDELLSSLIQGHLDKLTTALDHQEVDCRVAFQSMAGGRHCPAKSVRWAAVPYQGTTDGRRVSYQGPKDVRH